MLARNTSRFSHPRPLNPRAACSRSRLFAIRPPRQCWPGKLLNPAQGATYEGGRSHAEGLLGGLALRGKQQTATEAAEQAPALSPTPFHVGGWHSGGTLRAICELLQVSSGSPSTRALFLPLLQDGELQVLLELLAMARLLAADEAF
jgi:hypothetical protein